MELLNLGEVLTVQAGAGNDEIGHLHGHYDIECRDAEGTLLWKEGFDNLVVTVGKTQLLVSGVVGSEPAYMGLIAGATGTVAAADTMASHVGWLEADATNAPEYSGNRPSVTFGAAAGGQIISNSTNQFVFTNSGTVCGAFMNYGPGATNTQGGTVGVLLSAGTFTAQPVITGNTITVGYTLQLN
jgi:hypothetical protein